jgi:hypothetical protein
MKSAKTQVVNGALFLLSVLLTACFNDVGITAYTIGGTLTGLTGTGLVLQNNARDNLALSTNGAFTFSISATKGMTYNVTILTQPAGQTCSVSSGAGTASSSNITNVAVVCANAYSVGGSVTGLTGNVVLQDNNGDNLTVSANGAFTFATPVANGSPYSVSVLTQPANQVCSVPNGAGTIALANVGNIVVVCAS